MTYWRSKDVKTNTNILQISQSSKQNNLFLSTVSTMISMASSIQRTPYIQDWRTTLKRRGNWVTRSTSNPARERENCGSTQAESCNQELGEKCKKVYFVDLLQINCNFVIFTLYNDIRLYVQARLVKYIHSLLFQPALKLEYLLKFHPMTEWYLLDVSLQRFNR